MLLFISMSIWWYIGVSFLDSSITRLLALELQRYAYANCLPCVSSIFLNLHRLVYLVAFPDAAASYIINNIRIPKNTAHYVNHKIYYRVSEYERYAHKYSYDYHNLHRPQPAPVFS